MPKTTPLNFERAKPVAVVAELGSDPNSAKQHRFDHQGLPELGSDPNSAAQPSDALSGPPTVSAR